ncbi:hypothetical protein VTJ04DRAFT_4434 [Mycothermus thermophilus]|uniref:uncharacterized protein n=1 Tax=Humicola insolens TaxID=85995 RepID=UPI0037440A78
MTATILRAMRVRPHFRPNALRGTLNSISTPFSTVHQPTRPPSTHSKHPTPHHHHPVVDHDVDLVPHLAKQPQHALSLADLVKHGRPPLSAEALLASARFTLSLLPIRLARRIQALRNLPYIVVSNPNIRRIYNNYQHSLSTLLPWQGRTISNLEDEIRFTEVLAELVQTHTDTIPVLARGFLECRKYISPDEVTRFLDEHLRARIGTRLIAEHHIALHFSSTPYLDRTKKAAAAAAAAAAASGGGTNPTTTSTTSTPQTTIAMTNPSPPDPPPPLPPASYIGVIDTSLRPASLVDSCGHFVADICELSYGVRPQWIINGEPDTTFAFVPSHLEYILTELLKNAFRATVENGMSKEPVVITVAPEPPEVVMKQQPSGSAAKEEEEGGKGGRGGKEDARIAPIEENAPGVTIRIRDRGGGISPEVLPRIWSYSFTTFGSDDGTDFPSSSGGSGGGFSSMDDALNIISAASNGASSIAGLGYGLPLSRAYAEYFGGGIAVQSLYGWGTDVYLRLKGVGRVG